MTIINFMITCDDDLLPILNFLIALTYLIRVVVPTILIVGGLFKLLGAVRKKDDKKIKVAKRQLRNKLIASIIVVLILTIIEIPLSEQVHSIREAREGIICCWPI